MIVVKFSALLTIKFVWPREEFPAHTIVKRHPEEAAPGRDEGPAFSWTSHVGGGKGRTAGPSAASAASG
jgi:hypothetical protein